MSKETFPPESVDSIIKAIKEAERKLGSGSPGAAAVQARKQIEADALPRFASEAEARKAGRKTGDRGNIGGTDGNIK